MCAAEDSEDNGAITTEQRVSEHTPGSDGGCLSQDIDCDADIVGGIWIISGTSMRLVTAGAADCRCVIGCCECAC